MSVLKGTQDLRLVRANLAQQTRTNPLAISLAHAMQDTQAQMKERVVLVHQASTKR